jgi:hypothetical protein
VAVETSSLSMMMTMLAESDCVSLLSRSHMLFGSYRDDVVALEVPTPGQGPDGRLHGARGLAGDAGAAGVHRLPARRVRRAPGYWPGITINCRPEGVCAAW